MFPNLSVAVRTQENRTQKKSINLQMGMSLIEVLISLLLLGIVVVGYTGLELFGLNTVTNAHYRERALLIAAETRERIALNSLARDLYFDTSSWREIDSEVSADDACKKSPTLIDTIGSSCDFSARARLDMKDLGLLLRVTLPESQMLIQLCSDDKPHEFCIIVAWYKLNPRDCHNPDSDAANISDCIRVPMKVI